FEIAEEQVLRPLEIDRIVPDVAGRNHLQDVRPDGRMQPHVFVDLLGLEAQHHAHPLHVHCLVTVVVNSGMLFAFTASQSQSIPIPGSLGARAWPSSIFMRLPVISSSWGIYSTYLPF